MASLVGAEPIILHFFVSIFHSHCIARRSWLGVGHMHGAYRYLFKTLIEEIKHFTSCYALSKRQVTSSSVLYRN